jgi:hypothetical protein
MGPSYPLKRRLVKKRCHSHRAQNTPQAKTARAGTVAISCMLSSLARISLKVVGRHAISDAFKNTILGNLC